MKRCDRVFQTYLNIEDFDASTADGVALLAVPHRPASIIHDLSDFYGQLLLTYPIDLRNLPLYTPLTSPERCRIGGALSFADQVIRDLKRMTGVRPAFRPGKLACPLPT